MVSLELDLGHVIPFNVRLQRLVPLEPLLAEGALQLILAAMLPQMSLKSKDANYNHSKLK